MAKGCYRKWPHILYSAPLLASICSQCTPLHFCRCRAAHGFKFDSYRLRVWFAAFTLILYFVGLGSLSFECGSRASLVIESEASLLKWIPGTVQLEPRCLCSNPSLRSLPTRQNRRCLSCLQLKPDARAASLFPLLSLVFSRRSLKLLTFIAVGLSCFI